MEAAKKTERAPRYGTQDWLETPIKASDYPPGGTGLPDGEGGTITMRELAKAIEEEDRGHGHG